MATTTNLSTLKINYLTQEQYDTALANNQINSDELYLTPSSPIDTQILSRPDQLNGLDDDTLQTLVSTSRADRLMFLPADQIIIEKTTDGGTTWTDAGISDTTKTALFSEIRPSGVAIPLLNSVKNVNCGLRITITAMKYNVPSGTAETAKYNYWNSSYISAAERYSNLKELYLWVNTNSDGLSLKVEAAKGNASTTWVNIYDSGSNFALTGWAGCDYIRFPQQQLFGGSTSQTGQYWNYRFTFFTRNQSGGTTLSTNSSYTGTAQSILEIRGYGDSVWRTPNNFMANDHIYTWDQDQNTTFPSDVRAGSFKGQNTVEYIKGTQTTSTNAWTGVTTDSALYDGKMIMYVLPYAGTSTGATLNLTLSGGGTTGAKPIYRYGGTTAITTHYAADSRILLIYDSTNNRWNSSAWYNSDQKLRTYKATNNIELPLLLRNSTGSQTAANADISTYHDGYGAIAGTNTPTINPSTGVLTANSPTFTGTPVAPTATAGTNTTQIATTAFVKTAVQNATVKGTLNLNTTWSGNGPYTQTVTLSGYTATANTKVDIQLTAAQIAQLITDGVTSLLVSNSNGTLTMYATGAAPTTAMTIQVTCTEVTAA